MAGAGRKVTTGLTGLAVATEPVEQLSKLYEKTLRMLSRMPPTAGYRVNTEAIVKSRMHCLQTEKQVEKIEAKLNAGQIEEVILQAERELQLARNMLLWKPWEPLIAQAPKKQWQWPIA